MCEGIALNEPQGSTFVVSIACSVEIYGRIWGREPIPKVLSNLVPCEND